MPRAQHSWQTQVLWKQKKKYEKKKQAILCIPVHTRHTEVWMNGSRPLTSARSCAFSTSQYRIPEQGKQLARTPEKASCFLRQFGNFCDYASFLFKKGGGKCAWKVLQPVSNSTPNVCTHSECFAIALQKQTPVQKSPGKARTVCPYLSDTWASY